MKNLRSMTKETLKETERFFSAFHQTKGGQAGGFRMTKDAQNDKEGLRMTKRGTNKK